MLGASKFFAKVAAVADPVYRHNGHVDIEPSKRLHLQAAVHQRADQIQPRQERAAYVQR